MASTERTDIIIPELLQEAIKGAFAGMSCLAGSGAAIMKTGLPGSARGGDVVKVPYFGNIGELEDVAEGSDLTETEITQSSEQAVVQRAGKLFSATNWAQNAAAEDPYAEAARQMRDAVARRADKALIDVASNTAGLPSYMISDVYNAGAPVKLSYDQMVDARTAFGDEGDRIALVAMHSKVYGDLMKIKTADGLPLISGSPQSPDAKRFAGLPLHVSDRCPVEFPTITATGTSPPAVTVTGQTTLALNKLRIEITTLGALGVSRFRVSFDGGASWAMTNVATAATVALTLKDGSATGLTATFAAGTAAVDNVYVGTPKYSTLFVRSNALAFWYTETPRVESDRDIRKDKDLTAVHVYFAAHRYSRLPGSVYGGVFIAKHN